MKSKILFAVASIAMCSFATSAHSQSKTSQLIVTNGTNTSKLTPSADGLVMNTPLVLQSPSDPTALMVIQTPAPTPNSTTIFTLPSASGTLLTSGSGNTFTATQIFPTTNSQGDALINSINSATAGIKINAGHLDVSASGLINLVTGSSDIVANSLLGVVSLSLAGTIGSNTTGNAATASLAANASQLGGVPAANYLTTSSSAGGDLSGTFGNLALAGISGVAGSYTNANITVDAKGRITTVSSGSAGSVSVNASLAYTGPVLGIDLGNPNNWTGVQSLPVTQAQGNNLVNAINSGNTSINIGRVNTSTLALAATTLTANAPLTGTGTLGANISLGLSTNATMSTAGGTLGIDLAHANSWSGVQTFTQTIAGSVNGNAVTATTADALANAGTAGTSAVTAINHLSATGTIGAARGGTGTSTYAQGDLLVGNSSGTLSKISAGTSTYVLTSNGTNTTPSWQPVSSSGGASTSAANTWTQKQTFTGNVQIGNTAPTATVTAVLYQLQNLNLPSTPGKDCSETSFLMSNVAVGDVVDLGIPASAVPSKGSFMAWVSSAGNVTVRFCNPDNNTAMDPAAADFKIMVTKIQ